MKAAWYGKTGPARDVLQIGELPAPAPKPGEVLVRVRASGINPIDTKWRSGLKPLAEGARMVPHFDGSGTIEAVGDGVEKTRVGQRVWIFETLFRAWSNAAWQWDATGTAAEFATVPGDKAIVLPGTMDFSQGACLGIPALTAHRCVFADGGIEGQTILVTGGGGAVSWFAIQMAKLGGAKVIATVSGEPKAALAREAGADHLVNYKESSAVEQIKGITGAAGVDLIVEVALAANLAASVEVIANDGVIAAYASDANPEPKLPFRAFMHKSVTLRHVMVFGMPPRAKAKAIADITGWIEGGRLKSKIGARFPLDRIADAHQAVEGGALGKVVLDL